MADATPSRIGQVNQSGDALALFLKVFAGEVLTAFDRESVTNDHFLTRTIASGKSASFPVLGFASAYYHTPGAEIGGLKVGHNERLINIEDMLVAPIFIANIDEAMNHFDVRSPYSNEIGQVLAKTYDKDRLRAAIMAARETTPNVTGLPVGDVQIDADFDTDGTKLFVGVFNAGVALDENDVPNSGRRAYMKPVQYALLVRSEKPIDRDLNPQPNGGLAEGLVYRVNGMPIKKTNNLPQEDDRANTAIPAGRRKDFSVTQALIADKSAVGTVKLQDVTMESEYDIRRQGTLMLGKYLVGHGGLRPEAAAELQTQAPAT